MSSVFDEKYDIRQARYDEIDEIMQFIDTHWKKGHIMATNRMLFEYEYVVNGELNFYIAKNKETNLIIGIIGYLFASLNSEKLDIWGSIWKIRNDVKTPPFLGFELLKRMVEHNNARNYIVVGSNPNTATPILKTLWSYKDNTMKHYYRLSERKEYKFSKIVKKIKPVKDETIPQEYLKEINSFDELEKIFNFSTIEDKVPFKDKWYYRHRFFEHPVYNYKIYSSTDLFIITREQSVKDIKILRIVDLAGNLNKISNLFNFFEDLSKEYEYIDFYNLGLEDASLKKAGFLNKNDTPENIIPNYFSPFVQENVNIHVAYKDNKCLFFKADSDQDRPN